MKYYYVYGLMIAVTGLQVVFQLAIREWGEALAWGSAALAWFVALSAARTGERWRGMYDQLAKNWGTKVENQLDR